MLTTALNPNTFSINNKTYTVGQQIQLTEDEQKRFDEIVVMSNDVQKQRTDLMLALYKENEAFNADTARAYYKYDLDSKTYNYHASKLMGDVVLRLGGLLPIRLVTEGGNKGIYVRPLNQNEPIVISTDIAKIHSQYSRQVEDLLIILQSLMTGQVNAENKEKIKFKPNNWPLMGMPYVSTKTEHSGFPIDFAKEMTEFKWEKIEHTVFDNFVVTGLVNVLNTPGRVDTLQNGMWPFPMVAILVGDNEILALNLGEAQNDQQRTQILSREVLRTGAKYLILYQFGILNTNGSIIDMEPEAAKSQPTYGFTISVTMVGKDNKVLMGAKNWRLSISPNKEVQMNIYGVFEDHLGLPDPQVRRFIEQMFAQLYPVEEEKPKLELVK